MHLSRFLLFALAISLIPAPAAAQLFAAPLAALCLQQSNGNCVPVAPTNPIPVTGGGAATPTGSAGSPNAAVVSVQGVAGGQGVDTVVRGASTDRGGLFGTTATQVMAANTSRRGIVVQVQSTTSNCYINGTTTATTDYHSLQILAGGYYESPSHHVGTGAISIICTAASTPVYIREF